MKNLSAGLGGCLKICKSSDLIGVFGTFTRWKVGICILHGPKIPVQRQGAKKFDVEMLIKVMVSSCLA